MGCGGASARAGRRLRINSDARYRFERGIDPAFTRPGMELATRMILDLCGGQPACAEACPTGAITYVESDWTGLGKMRQWAEKTDTQPRA